MKLVILSLIALLLASCISPSQSIQAVEGDLILTLEVNGIVERRGVIRVALYNSKSGWLDIEQSVRARLQIVQSENETISFYGIPKGEYALAVFHDLNSNNKMDKRWFIIPAEPFGFSNNTVGKTSLGPPSYEKASFYLDKDTTVGVELVSIFN